MKPYEEKGRDKLRDWLEESYHEISHYLDFPPDHWKKIKSTNPLERLNEEIRRRERCVRIFPNENSCVRLFGAILQGYSDDWTSGKLYLSEPLDKISENRLRLIPVSKSASDGLQPIASMRYVSENA